MKDTMDKGRRGTVCDKHPHKVCIVDYIGSHCGMHYYDEAFASQLGGISGMQVIVLSNYSVKGEAPFFRNFYNVPKPLGILYVLSGLIKVAFRVIKERDTIYVHISFGNPIDMALMSVLSMARSSVVDIHEAIAQRSDESRLFRRVFGWLYRKTVKNVIIHSRRTALMLDELGYTGRRFVVPHFPYGVSRESSKERVGSDIAAAFDKGRVNILFFGNIMYNKGVDLLIDAVGTLTAEEAGRIMVVIAGKQTDNTLDGCLVKYPGSVRIIPRHIDDEELAFLYSGTDYVILPYRKTSQSGIMEMAFHFRKPVIAADLPYFRQMLNDLPSFGVLTATDAASLAHTIMACADISGGAACGADDSESCRGFGDASAEGVKKMRFFSENDIYKYEHRQEIDTFIQEFGSFILDGVPNQDARH